MDGVVQDVKLPQHKCILPGVVSHSTNVVEHPELVSQRILRFADIVGRERVIASTDCGMGGRIHPDIAWAKFDSLAEGARLASKKLWALDRDALKLHRHELAGQYLRVGRLLREQPQLDERFAEHGQRLGIESPVVGQHRCSS